ncbi:MAG: acyltransferase [Gemmatimonadales bacterium]
MTLPSPRAVTVPYRLVYTTARGVIHAFRRTLIAEPIFKSYCTVVGKRVRTGIFVHWVMGRGRIIVGDDVLLDGKISFSFAARFVDEPTLRIGDRTGIGHACAIIVGEAVTIGSDCRIASGVQIRDSPGHPVEPEARRRGEPPPRAAVRPIVIEDNVWIGSDAMVHAGVTIGRGSVVSSGAVVMNDVPPFSLVAGNPARRIGSVIPAPPTTTDGS